MCEMDASDSMCNEAGQRISLHCRQYVLTDKMLCCQYSAYMRSNACVCIDIDMRRR